MKLFTSIMAASKT